MGPERPDMPADRLRALLEARVSLDAALAIGKVSGEAGIYCGLLWGCGALEAGEEL